MGMGDVGNAEAEAEAQIPSPTQTQTQTHLYPQALQLKLYQAFIFSIPILFSIILFLLFYLFYLKRRASNNLSASASAAHILPTTFHRHPTPYLNSSPCELSLEKDLRDKLPIVFFDEELSAKDTQCCVCLGEFEMKEELLQLPSCKHVFHVECMHHWLHSNSTCPLCRSSVTLSVTPTTKLSNSVACGLTHHHQHQPPPSAAELPQLQLQLYQSAASSVEP